MNISTYRKSGYRLVAIFGGALAVALAGPTNAADLVGRVRVDDDVVVQVEHDVVAVALLDLAAQLGDHTAEAEIAAVTVKGRKGETVVSRDETPFTCDISKIPGLKPAFAKDGTVTAASSSSISDGAAALILMRESTAKARDSSRLAACSLTPATRTSRSGSPLRRSVR